MSTISGDITPKDMVSKLIVTLIMPGMYSISVLLVTFSKDIFCWFESHKLTSGYLLGALIFVSMFMGMICQSIGGHIEIKWIDEWIKRKEKRKKDDGNSNKKKVDQCFCKKCIKSFFSCKKEGEDPNNNKFDQDWYNYLAITFNENEEPIAQRHLRRLLIRMKFKVNFVAAAIVNSILLTILLGAEWLKGEIFIDSLFSKYCVYVLLGGILVMAILKYFFIKWPKKTGTTLVIVLNLLSLLLLIMSRSCELVLWIFLLNIFLTIWFYSEAKAICWELYKLRKKIHSKYINTLSRK